MEELNYIDAIAVEVGSRCDLDFATPDVRRLLRTYALLALARGVATTREDVHDAWSAWRAETIPRHAALRPFAELDAPIQALDEKYREAIVEVAVGLAERGAPEVGPRVKAAFEGVEKLFDAHNGDWSPTVCRQAHRVIDELADQMDQAGMIIEEGARMRERLAELLDVVAVTLMGPPKPGQRHNLGAVPRAAAELREKVPVGIVGVNGHDAGRQAELAALRIAVVQRDKRIAVLEQGLRAACEQRDAYKAKLPTVSLAAAVEATKDSPS